MTTKKEMKKYRFEVMTTYEMTHDEILEELGVPDMNEDQITGLLRHFGCDDIYEDAPNIAEQIMRNEPDFWSFYETGGDTWVDEITPSNGLRIKNQLIVG